MQIQATARGHVEPITFADLDSYAVWLSVMQDMGYSIERYGDTRAALSPVIGESGITIVMRDRRGAHAPTFWSVTRTMAPLA